MFRFLIYTVCVTVTLLPSLIYALTFTDDAETKNKYDQKKKGDGENDDEMLPIIEHSDGRDQGEETEDEIPLVGHMTLMMKCHR